MLGRGRPGLVFGSRGVGLQLLPREVRTLAAIGLAGKCASDLLLPALSAASGWDRTAPVGAWLAVEGRGRPGLWLGSPGRGSLYSSRAEDSPGQT